jgi:hypothetical protein
VNDCGLAPVTHICLSVLPIDENKIQALHYFSKSHDLILSYTALLMLPIYEDRKSVIASTLKLFHVQSSLVNTLSKEL